MAGNYTIKILSPDDFGKLPFSRIQEDGVLGAADSKSGVAYIKDTGYNDITKDVISHELEELMAKESPHEDADGIRYFSLGGLFSSIGSGLGSIGSSIWGGAKSLGRGIKNILTPGPAAPYEIGPGGRPITGTPQGPYPAAGSGPTDTGPGGIGTIFGAPQAATPPAIPGGGITGGAGSAAKFAQQMGQYLTQPNWFENMFSGIGKGINKGVGAIGDMFKGGGGTAGSPYDFLPDFGSGSGETRPSGSMMDTFKQALPGMAISGLGQLLAPKVDDIDIRGITGEARDRITGANPSELFSTGADKLIGNIRSDNLAPPEEAFTRGDQVIEEDLADQITQLEHQFKAATGNADVYNNSAFLAEKSRLEERAREHRAAVRDEISFQFTREQLTRDLQEIELALNLDSAQTAQLISLAQLDAEALAFNYGIDMQEAREFKGLFADFGQLMVENKIQANRPQEAEVA